MACKEWNAVPKTGSTCSACRYDNTGALGANSWRHVAFIEQPRPPGARTRPGRAAHRPDGHRATAEVVGPLLRGSERGGGELGTGPLPTAQGRDGLAGARRDLGMPRSAARRRHRREGRTAFRWLMASDVCKHCTHAGCLDVCPTGALFRTEFGTVVVQQDICNGCGYCVSGCPYGVIDRRPGDGRA